MVVTIDGRRKPILWRKFQEAVHLVREDPDATLMRPRDDDLKLACRRKTARRRSRESGSQSEEENRYGTTCS
jgi:hypothetical protein